MVTTIYLDNSATTQIRPEVKDEMLPYLDDRWGNPSSIHSVGRSARLAVNKAREQVAQFLGANTNEVFFSPSATYSNNQAILGRARHVEANGLGRHLITSGIEHSSALGPARHLESRGWRVTVLGVNREGFIDLDELRASISYDTSIISLMWGNNEVGTIQPIEEVAAIANRRGIFFHTDAVQVGGKLPIDVSTTPVDTLSLSGHKFHAPKGIGILYIRSRVEFEQLVFGGGQEKGIFPGTEGVANIVGIGKAADLAREEMELGSARLRQMQRILLGKLANDSNVIVTGPRDIRKRVPGHVSVLVKGAVGEMLVDEASASGVFISSVSACAGREPSHVLSQLGYSIDESISSARITAGRLNSVEECERAAEVLGELFEKFIQPADNVYSLPSVSRTALGY